MNRKCMGFASFLIGSLLGSAAAASLEVVAPLGGNADGQYPASTLVRARDGRIYGTTQDGGAWDAGTIVEMEPGGSGLRVLYSFDGVSAAHPAAALIEGRDGALYGTTRAGGGFGLGTVFRISKAGQFRVLASFEGRNGRNPAGRLLESPDGTLWGTTEHGGRYGNSNPLVGGYGTVFALRPGGGIQTVGDFDGRTLGAFPRGGVTLGAGGVFYASAPEGGRGGAGTLVRINRGGLSLVYAFQPGRAARPGPDLSLGRRDELCGVTEAGPGRSGRGTVFCYAGHHLSVLAAFDGANGARPMGGLAPDGAGAFVGVTAEGGSDGQGTIFRYDGSALLVLAHFTGPSGARPAGPPIRDLEGGWLGFTTYGGLYSDPAYQSPSGGYGAVFRLEPAGSQLVALHSFQPTSGHRSTSELTLASDGQFYGVMSWGGERRHGSVVRLSSDGVLQTLASFDGSNGNEPRRALVEGPDGALYGCAFYGGDANQGTVFRVRQGALERVHSFTGGAGGALPFSALAWSPAASRFYGTTMFGGDSGGGTIFSVTPAGGFELVASFPAPAYPQGGLTLASDGFFYGVTPFGGVQGEGSLFRWSAAGGLETLWSFSFEEGAYPLGPLVELGEGLFYGVASVGGAGGVGSIFRFTVGQGVQILHEFSGPDGHEPLAGLTLGPDGRLYGSTLRGGGWGVGTFYAITAQGQFELLAELRPELGAEPNGCTAGLDAALYCTAGSGGVTGRGSILRLLP